MMSSSSDEDDEVDAAQLAALRSVAIDSAAVVVNASVPAPSHRKAKSWKSGNDNDARMTDVKQGKETSGLKLYQTRVCRIPSRRFFSFNLRYLILE